MKLLQFLNADKWTYNYRIRLMYYVQAQFDKQYFFSLSYEVNDLFDLLLVKFKI